MVEQRLDGVQARVDAVRVQQGPSQPVPQEARAHGGPGAVERLQQGSFHLPRPQVLHQFQVEPGVLVQQHEPRGLVGLDPVQVGRNGGLVLSDIVEQGADRGDRLWLVRQPEAVQPGDAAVFQHAARGPRFRPNPGFQLGHGGVQALQGPGQGRILVRGRGGQQHFAGFQPDQFVDDAGAQFVGVAVVQLGRLAGTFRHVACRDARAEPVGCQVDGGQPVAARGQEVRRGQGAPRKDLGNLPVHKALARLAHLLGDGDLDPAVHELGQVGVDRVVRNPRQRHPLIPAHRARGQRDFADVRQHLGVLVERLVEVAHAEQQQRVRVLLLQFQVLGPHRGGHAGCRWPGAGCAAFMRGPRSGCPRVPATRTG